ncbi:hypothetical protein [Pedosphaera parvula]|uniref:Outer membrane protein beta-barrel domain-containing protein n=1 Tax=Pedosphaera parvula (strain Ellin514) TaxID=320771 RepID=B9XM03_PEDPL|nr:hypothetical protein [Pedosphaera parvula]EEF59131.1 hypothetical protein Cflav_PD1623 [Pedosphaera parvula Ellin514]
MNHHHRTSFILAACTLAVPTAAMAEQSDTNTNSPNHFSFAARAGFNISAKFKNLGNLTLHPNQRTTPNGKPYNYDNGYVYKDVSGSVDGQTWNWGYDNSASQISGNTILMNRSSVGANVSSPNGVDRSDANYGAEFVYNRELGKHGKMTYGLEVAANYLRVDLNDHSSFFGSATRTTDAYAFTPGTTPPQAPPAYQGSFDGPGFVIGSTPVSSTAAALPGGAAIVGNREFNANIWGLRLGPYVEFPLCNTVNLSLSAGLAAALVNGSASWSETAFITGGGTATGSGSGHDLSMLYGGYVNAKVEWQLSERWSAEGGVQFQTLSSYEHNFSGRTVELDLSQSIFITLGAGYKF